MRPPFVHEWFATNTRTHASRVAIERGEQRLSYGELDARTNAWAALLRQGGARTGTLVGILTHDTVDAIAAILAVLKAGAAFVPLDPRVPDERLAVLLREVPLDWLLVSPGEIARAGTAVAASCPNCRMAAFGRDLDRDAHLTDLPDVPRDPDDLCSLFFTSGSTGRPKAIAGRLKAIDHFVRWEIETFGVGEGARVSQLTSVAFDAVLRDIFTPLCAGGTICVPQDRELLLDGPRFVQWIDESRLTLLHSVPSMFRVILRERPEAARFADLRYVLLAGEPLLPSDVRTWRDLVGSRIGLVNLYGPSETTMIKFAHVVTEADAQRQAVPIGRPIDGTRALLVNDGGKPCPPGAIGEIYIRTPYRSLGYYGQPEQTAQVFVPNPFSSDPRDLVYRTGDLARMLDDGSYEFLGRRDYQVKIHGVRVELGEIETAIRRDARVRDVAVVDRDDATGAKYLCAYLVLEDGCLPQEVQSRLVSLLPDMLLPRRYVVMDLLPRTLTGKVDRRALPLPADLSQNAADAPPRTVVEGLVATVWAQVLGRDRAGRDEHFFESGGHSLLATQLFSRLRPLFPIDLALRWLFEAPTLAGFAARIQGALDAGATAAPRPIVRRAGSREAPLSFAQQRFWLLDQLDPGSTAYHISAAVRLKGPLDPATLRRALDLLVRRHESLRTAFVMDDGRPRQVVTSADTLGLPVVDLSAVGESSAAAAARRRARQPFSLDRAPLLRVTLFLLGPADVVALFTAHHIIADAWSMGLLVQELATVYAALREDKAPVLPDLAAQYTDFVAWQREWLRPERIATRQAYWRRQLDAVVPLELPLDRPRPSRQSSRGATVEWRTPPDVARAVKTLGRRDGATTFMILLAAVQAVLGRHADADDVVIGSPVAVRPGVEWEGVVGLFLNTLALRTSLAGEPTVRELITRVRTAALDAEAAQDLPFELVLDDLAVTRDLSRQPLFQVMVVLQNAPTLRRLRLPEIAIEPFAMPGESAKLDLNFHIVEQGDELLWQLHYSTDLFERSTVLALLRRTQTWIAEAMARPDQPIATLSLLDESERRAVLEGAARTSRAYPAWPREEIQQSIADRFATVVQAHGARRAVRTTEHDWTYAELDRRARRIALAVVTQAGSGQRIALLFEHGAPMLAAILGVLMAGCAYVPCEPRGPSSRLRERLEDVEAAALVFDDERREMAASLAGEGLALIDVDALDARSVAEPFPTVSPEAPAYVLYTSGTTGRPRGVVQSQRNVLHFIQTYAGNLAITPDDRLTLCATYGFDAAVMDMFGALLTGASLYPVAVAREGPALAHRLTDERITIFHATPTVLRYLAGTLDADAILPEVRLVVLGGEAAYQHDARVVARHLPRATLVNGLGPTESTVTLQAFLEPGAVSPRHALPVGAPVTETDVQLLDRAGRDAEVYGEIVVRSPYVACEYWRQPDATAAAFGEDPAHGRRYRTGDLGRLLPDGSLEFVGRRDHQVKVRGYRVALDAIERTLADRPDVAAVAVKAWPDASGATTLVAYVVPRVVDAPVASWRAFLKERLPDYMIPAAFVPMDALPLTPNGKVDRHALPAPPAPQPQPDREAPRSALEAALAAIWADVLGREAPGIRENLFEVGGDSVHAMQIAARAHRLGIRLTPRQLFEHPTIAESAEAADAAGFQGDAAEPLTPAQRQILARESANPMPRGHVVLLEARTAVSAAIVHARLGEMTRAHRSLRQAIVPAAPGAWRPLTLDAGRAQQTTEIDLRGLTDGPDVERLARMLARTLDPAQGPLVVAALIQRRDTAPTVLLIGHRAIIDAAACRALAESLAAASPSEHRPAPIASPIAAATATDDTRPPLPSSALPADEEQGSATGGTIDTALDEEETAALTSGAAEIHGLRPEELLLAALVHAVTTPDARAVSIERLVDLRFTHDGASDEAQAVGCWHGWAPVHLTVPEETDWTSLFTAVKQQVRSTPAPASVPASAPASRSGQAPSARAWAATDGDASTVAELACAFLGDADLSIETSTFGHARLLMPPRVVLPAGRRLQVMAWVSERRLLLRWHWRGGAATRAAVSAIEARCADALRAMAADCRSAAGSAYSPADFPLANLDPQQLADVLTRVR